MQEDSPPNDRGCNSVGFRRKHLDKLETGHCELVPARQPREGSEVRHMASAGTYRCSSRSRWFRWGQQNHPASILLLVRKVHPRGVKISDKTSGGCRASHLAMVFRMTAATPRLAKLAC